MFSLICLTGELKLCNARMDVRRHAWRSKYRCNGRELCGARRRGGNAMASKVKRRDIHA
jgi:hypothetical protein